MVNHGSSIGNDQQLRSAIDPRPTLISAASHFYQLGWMVGTAGNLSAKQPDGSFWITASGCHKGQLGSKDFIPIATDGRVVEKTSPESRP